VILTGFGKFAAVPQEQINDKITRRVISGQQGTLVYWTFQPGAIALDGSSYSGRRAETASGTRVRRWVCPRSSLTRNATRRPKRAEAA